MERLGIIGGTGLVSLDQHINPLEEFGCQRVNVEQILCETPFGEVPLDIQDFETPSGRKKLVFIQRHHSGSGHASRPPHSIDHRANIWAMKNANIEAVLSVCSVGAINTLFPPGRIGIASQYIDLSGVSSTFHDNVSVFTSMTIPFDELMNETLRLHLKQIQELSEEDQLDFTYWLAQGPQFETAAEIDAIEKLGGDVVGMTMPREAKLCAEVNLRYAALLISSNWAAGREPGDSKAALSHHDVSSKANERLEPVWSCISHLISE